MKNCFLFPGQGAQYPGMAKDFYDASKAVRELFNEASEAAAMDLKKLIFEGDEETLRQTRNTQISMVVAEAASALMAREHGIMPGGAAGFSVDEWPALAVAKVISSFDMFRLVSERGRLMEEAGNRAGSTTMSAVLYLSPEKIEQVIHEAGLRQCWIANYNSPVQCVISGTEADIAVAEERLRQAGAKRVIRLKVSGAFHSPLMQDAYESFKELVEATQFSDPKINLYSNVTGKKMLSKEDAKKYASLQIISPVRWIDEEKSIAADGYDYCFETGPGTVLAGLWKASGSSIPCIAAGTLQDLAAFSL